MAAVHIGFVCNGCKASPIFGTRWHCSTCQQANHLFNICNMCNAKYDHVHKLTPIRKHSEAPRYQQKAEPRQTRNKYEKTPKEINERFVRKLMQEPLETPKREERQKRDHNPIFDQFI